MCGRYRREADEQQIAEAFHVNGPSIESLMLAPNGDIRPTTFQPIVRADEEGAPFIEHARWGFVPFWQKDTKFPPTTFSARAEGIEKAPMWRHSLEAKRCLIPADSFSSGSTSRRRAILSTSSWSEEAFPSRSRGSGADGRILRTRRSFTASPSSRLTRIPCSSSITIECRSFSNRVSMSGGLLETEFRSIF